MKTEMSYLFLFCCILADRMIDKMAANVASPSPSPDVSPFDSLFLHGNANMTSSGGGATALTLANLTNMSANDFSNTSGGPWNSGNGTIIGPPDGHAHCLLFDFIIEAVMMGLLCLFGFTGNTLSMICLWRDRSKTATPFLLVSLEVADTMFLVTVLILRVLTSIHTFTGWLEDLMRVFPYIGTYVWPFALISECATIYLTLLVTVNRYISVCRPYEASDLCSIYHARRHVVGVTIFCILYNLPRFFEYKVIKYKNMMGNDEIRSVPSTLGANIYYQIIYSNFLYFLVMFLVPLVTLVILNYKLVTALRKTKKKRAQLLSSSSEGSSHSRSEDDITLILIVVVLVFVICQTPALITQSLFSFLSDDKRMCPKAFFYYERISDLMVVANSSMNFIIYCFCSRKFRQILVELLCKKKLESPEPSQHSHGNHSTIATGAGGRCKLPRLSRCELPQAEKCIHDNHDTNENHTKDSAL